MTKQPARSRQLEERLRNYVRRHIARHADRYGPGEKIRFAAAIGRSPQWMTSYIKDGANYHPDLDTTVLIARELKLSLEELARAAPLPEPDPHTERLAKALALVPPEDRDMATDLAVRVIDGLRRDEKREPDQAANPATVERVEPRRHRARRG